MLTKGQFFRYNTEWKAVCSTRNWKVNDEAARLAFHREHNLPDSRKDWNTRNHFDTFLAACKEAKGQRTGGSKRTDEDGERRRLVWRIKDDAKKAGLSPAYIAECARDLHVLGNWEDLDIDSLTNLMMTIHNRAGRKLGHDPRNVRHTAPRRQYVLDKVPRMFTPRRANKQATATTAPTGSPGDMIASDINAHWKNPEELIHALDPDNEPF